MMHIKKSHLSLMDGMGLEGTFEGGGRTDLVNILFCWIKFCIGTWKPAEMICQDATVVNGPC